MVSKTKGFLSVKEAAEYTGKSESTLKRMVKKVVSEKPSMRANKKVFIFEKLSTGKEKIYISKALLKSTYEIQKSNDQVNDQANAHDHSNKPLSRDGDDTVSQSVISLLRTELEFKNEQLKVKDEQLKAKDEQLVELTKIIDQAQQLNAQSNLNNKPLELEAEATKRRWWHFKK